LISPRALELDGRFRDAVADDLDLPSALVVVNDAASSSVPDGEKYALLSSWDSVLGLDLERTARQELGASSEIEALMAERDAAASTSSAGTPGRTARNAASCASRTTAWTSPTWESARPTATVLVRSEQYR